MLEIGRPHEYLWLFENTSNIIPIYIQKIPPNPQAAPHYSQIQEKKSKTVEYYQLESTHAEN